MDPLPLSDYPAFDATVFGRRIRAARIMAGYEDPRLFAADLRRHGLICSARALHEIERGIRVPTYPFVVVAAALCIPPGGRGFFEEAFTQDIRDHLESLRRMEPR